MFGVSPAFVFSLYGTGFTVPDFCDALPRIKRLGFEAFQPEIYVANAISEWLREAGRLQRTAADLNLVPTQFVAHFMLEWFARPERLGPDQGLDDLKRVVEVVRGVSGLPGDHRARGAVRGGLGIACRGPGAGSVGRHPTVA